ncbi:GH116 family glycosyl-hydrolase [Candidatus Harpocratesius sp.]
MKSHSDSVENQVNSAYNPKYPHLRANYDPDTNRYANYRTSKGFPLGGIGTGGFRIFTDGGFGNWQTNHNWFQPIKETKGTFFALWMKQDETMATRILRRSYENSLLNTEYKNIDPIENVLFEGKFPRFQILYGDARIPLKIELNGFTPFIPHNPKDSSLPVSIFRFKISNPTYNPIFTSLLFSFQNILGIGGSGGSKILVPFDGPVKYNRTNENYIQTLEKEFGSGLKFGTTLKPSKIDPMCRVIGDYYVFCHTPDIRTQSQLYITKCLQWDESADSASILEQFSVDGTLDEQADLKGQSGAFAVKFMVEPESNILIDFYVVWWLPQHVIEKKQRIRKLINQHWGIDYGHFYLNHFQTIDEIAKYIVDNHDVLYTESLALEYILTDSNLPAWLQNYLLNSMDVMVTNSVFTKEAKYYTIEGVPWDWPFGGLTGTNDQRLSSHIFLSIFFPSLNESELLTFLNLSENGKVPHGNGNCDIALGTAEVPYGRPIKMINKGKREWVDLTMSQILQMGRWIINEGKIDFLKKHWDNFLIMWKYLKHVSIDSIPEGITTYDVMEFGRGFIYSATLYLSTLQMLHQLVLKMQKNDTENLIIYQETAKEIYNLYSKVLTKIEYDLWNEKGYFQTSFEKDTIFTGALAGDWFSRYSGLKPILEFEKSLKMSQLQSKTLVDSHKYNYYKNQATMPLPYLEANIKGIEQIYHHLQGEKYMGNYIWQSISYQALEAIYLGRVEAGMQIIKMIFDKGFYEGYPWDMNLFGRSGYTYMTRPVIWGVLHALSGMFYDRIDEKLILSPKVYADEDTLRIPVFFSQVYFMLDYNILSHEAKITVLWSNIHDKVIRTIIYRDVKGKDTRLPLSHPFPLKEGESWVGILPD